MIPIYYIKYQTNTVLQVIAIKKSIFLKKKNHLFFLLLYLKLGIKIIKKLNIKVLKEKYEIDSTPDEILETIKKI